MTIILKSKTLQDDVEWLGNGKEPYEGGKNTYFPCWEPMVSNFVVYAQSCVVEIWREVVAF